MKHLFIVFFGVFGVFNLGAQAATFSGTFWEKTQKCLNDPLTCLPQAVEKSTNFEFEYPTAEIPTELEITGKQYSVNIFMGYHVGEVDYYTVQFTIKDLEGNVIALCSRYEAVDSIEEIPVGSCGGINPSKENTLAGFTVSLPKN